MGAIVRVHLADPNGEYMLLGDAPVSTAYACDAMNRLTGIDLPGGTGAS